jgi:hypothetical protein
MEQIIKTKFDVGDKVWVINDLLNYPRTKLFVPRSWHISEVIWIKDKKNPQGYYYYHLSVSRGKGSGMPVSDSPLVLYGDYILPLVYATKEEAEEAIKNRKVTISKADIAKKFKIQLAELVII